MKGTHQRRQGKSGFDLIEEATHLLRGAPPAALAAYYVGGVPFVLGLLYFWADMSRSPFAREHLVDFALGMATLFLWMKFWQVIFARHLRAHVAAEPAQRWTIRRCGRIALTQTILQPSALFVFPLSLVPILPAAWVVAFYQNVTVLDNGSVDGISTLLKRSWKQATLWPRQNHFVLAIMAAFGFYVFLNWAVVGWMLPRVIRMLFGVESVFARSTFGMLNTTFFAGMFGLTYLCVDPILKAIYVLRCFYGESLESGEDLRAELNSFAAAPMVTLVALLLVLCCASPAVAADPSAPPAPPPRPQVSSPVPPPELDRAISQTIRETKYTWRMPREQIVEPDSGNGILARFLHKVGQTLRNWARAVWNWLDKWIRRLFPHHRTPSYAETSGYGWILSLQLLLYGLAATVLAALAVFFYRIWRDRRRLATAVASDPLQPVPDLDAEGVGADQLPEDQWTALARELLERGECRLAMRAFYLASLSHLAARNLISIARFKSNHEYERELCRRGHSFPDVLSAFGDNILLFERIWYGLHEVNRELVNHFAANVERMKTAG